MYDKSNEYSKNCQYVEYDNTEAYVKKLMKIYRGEC